MKQYRVIVTLQAPFQEPVEMPYGPWTTDKFQALASLTTAFATHDPDDRWTACKGVRIDIRDVEDEAEHRAATGQDAVEDGAQFDRDNPPNAA